MNNPESIRHFIRVLALSYPDVVEEFPWGNVAFKIRKKAFLFMGSEPPDLTFSVKLPNTGELALGLPFTEPAPYGLGKHGWVLARIAPGEETSLDM
ncbi:MAG: MmcQ/YjbR family DNA-binding protein, partial [Rhodothermales bacterium]|nr:MmcQ/YjbR family DNA-binding protein [Rhodothermales bacterium]